MRKLTFLPAIGLTLFLYIIYSVGLFNIVNQLKSVNLLYLMAAWLMIIPFVIIKALKWKRIIQCFNVDYKLKEAFNVIFIGWFIGLITPARAGDFTRAVYLKNDKKLSLGKSLTTVFLDRALDILVLFILAFFGTSVLASTFLLNKNILFIVASFFILFLVCLFLLMKKEWIILFLKPIYNKLIPLRFKKKLAAQFNEFYNGLSIIRKNKLAFIKAFLLTVMLWFLSIFQFYLIAYALNLKISYYFLLLFVPITIILELIPITISGIGTRDGAFILFLSLASISSSAAVSFSFLVLIINYLTVVPGFLLWLKKPIKI